MGETGARAPSRWLMLGVSMLGQVAATIYVNGAPFLIPYLHLERGLSLPEAGVIAAAPFVGVMATLVLWGLVVDRIGERASMAAGLAIVTVGATGAAFSSSLVALGAWFVLGGIGAGSTNSASGRIVVGWFPAHRRGLAMGIRQTALPLGVGAAALLVPNTVSTEGLRATLLVTAAICAAATALAALLIVDPPRPSREQAADSGQLVNPYRRDHRLTRIHLASALLVIPQFTVWTYMLVWLIDEKGWSTFAASALVAATQLLGAAGRIGAGWWSDRVGSRLGPMRVVAIAAAATMLALGLLSGTPLGIALIVIATAVTVADNGLAFTSVAEIGGPYWSGRAMGLQNTGQYVVSAAVPPLIGALISGHGYAVAFAVVALAPLLAIPLVPVRNERGSTRV
ncbi:MFS transporter [Aeromicrobium sp. SMF47]|uniref:MFS transporter n=1 Tax=Aeromicrobium yanjiei TaxID=2662028 RepID=UPI00129D6D54|nr:MFS transporter [Aeromicrobium yanjiei]MRJ75855.1 MFS transporter [Aeromicrobium yanjiei]